MVKNLLLIVLLASFVSCSSDYINGSDFEAGETFTDSNIRILLIDTTTVATSTMKFDSIVTSEASRILVGKYDDPIFGTVEASSHIQLLPDSYTIDSEAVYDSILLYLNYDGYYYNDTLNTNVISIKQLSENLKPEDDAFYNTSFLETFDQDLGYLSFTPRPLGADSIQVKVDDAIGLEIFENLQEKTIVNSDEFTAFFKGIKIQAEDEDNSAILGFSLENSGMRLYYTVAEESEQVQYYTDFSINTASTPIPFFNSITAEEPITVLQSFTDQEDNLNSTDSGNKSFIQSGVGIATRIQLPFLKTLYDIQGNGTLLEAVLKLKPAAGSYNDNLMLRDTLSVYIVDQNNDISSQLTAQAILNRENQEFNDVFYELPLSSYLEELLTMEGDTDEALILLPNDYISTVDRFILNDSTGDEYKTTLEILYAVYDQD